MEWTFAEFFADGGTTTFVDRLTASLGIHASQVKIVSVYEGSLVVNYEVEPEEGSDFKYFCAIDEFYIFFQFF